VHTRTQTTTEEDDVSDESTRFDEVARSQHGLVTTQQATQILGRGRKARWVAEGRLVHAQPQVFRVSGAPETWHQAVTAAVLASGGIASHRTAAEIWGLLQATGHVEASVGPHHKVRLEPPAVVHRIADLRPDLAVHRVGIPVTDPVRTIIDLGLVLPQSCVADALSRGISTRLFEVREVRQLRDALGRPGRNGTGVLRKVLDRRLLAAAPEESVLEARLRSVIQRHGLPIPEFQYEVWHQGRFVARIDAAYPNARLGIEVDGFAHHSSMSAFQRDRTRQNRLVALGWTVLRFTWWDVNERPNVLAKVVRDTLERLAA
jgi:very-short-patch-repair endonuclease